MKFFIQCQYSRCVSTCSFPLYDYDCLFLLLYVFVKASSIRRVERDHNFFVLRRNLFSSFRRLGYPKLFKFAKRQIKNTRTIREAVTCSIFRGVSFNACNRYISIFSVVLRLKPRLPCMADGLLNG